MRMRNPLVAICIALMLLLTSCTNINIEHVSEDVIQIPAGYSFFTASSFGRVMGVTTLYIKDNKDASIYEYDYKNKEIGIKITPPEGYEIVSITEFGDVVGVKQFFCKNIQSGVILRCK
jgi:hypothetical protein